MVTTTSYKLKQCAWAEISESNLSWYGVFLRFKHSDNLTHLWSLVGIWVNTPQSCQKGSFKGTCRGPGLNGWVNHFFRAPAANHHFEPVNQIYLQDLTNSKNQEEYFYDDIMTYMWVQKVTEIASLFHTGKETPCFKKTNIKQTSCTYWILPTSSWYMQLQEGTSKINLKKLNFPYLICRATIIHWIPPSNCFQDHNPKAVNVTLLI